MKIRRFVAVLAVLALLGAACGDDDDNGGSAEKDDKGSSGPTFSGPVVIGAMLEQTGPLELLGKPSVAAAKAAVKTWNDKGGLGGNPVQLELCDTQSLPERALVCYDELRRKGVTMIVGPIATASGLPLIPLSLRDKVLFYPLSGSVLEENIKSNPYAFAGNTTATDALQAFFDWMRAEKLTSVSMLAQAGVASEPCKAALQSPVYAEARKGITVKSIVDFDRDAQTIVPQLANLQKADALLSCSSGTGTLINVAGWEETGLSKEMPIVAQNASQTDSTAKAISDRVKTVDKVHVLAYCTIMLKATKEQLGSKPPPCYEEAKKFETAMKQVDPAASRDGLTATTWDAVTQFLSSAAEVGDDNDAIAKHLEGQKDLAGAAGHYTFGPGKHRGLGKETIVVGHIQGGVWVPVWTDNLLK